ncbi:hypothetical protein N7478_006004 [Penicillium angulare]|uniref:uncharacterized protein n=1 Tax=Penicillium angulare TaxID=116970 RepID=UPI002540C363|nr:uncharacterized protein N7478_006004 [Penicillium angulare]KAJ5280632.1 hypothetical protein N7478_006004 [Penicillium angulare]
MQIKASSCLARGQPGVLHHINPRLLAFEHTRGSRRKPHTLIFVGGLGDGLGTVEYLADLAEAFESTEWTIFNLNLSCSLGGWGMGRLGQDIDEIAACVQYVREYKEPFYGTGKIILMGSSTGCQDVMHYISCPNPRPAHPIFDREWMPIVRPPVDGTIMQAPVSDREGILYVLEQGTERNTPEEMRGIYDNAVENAKNNTYEKGEGVDTVVPLSVTGRIGYGNFTPLSSRRFLSLTSPDSPENPEEDDLFSSDLSDQRLAETFGMVGERGLLKGKLLSLYSGRDQSVPPWVHKGALMNRWENAIDAGGKEFWDPRSLVIPNASHQLSDPDQAEPRRILLQRVTGFIYDTQRSTP